MMPRPPIWAMAIASRDSVTVSIAALSSGTFSLMFRVKRVETSTCVGSTVECCGTSSTSSNVSAVASSVSVGERVSAPLLFKSIPILCAAPGGRDAKGRHSSAFLSSGGAVALLVFLPAAARTRLVRPDLGAVTPHGLDHIVTAGPGGTRRLVRDDGARPGAGKRRNRRR